MYSIELFDPFDIILAGAKEISAHENVYCERKTNEQYKSFCDDFNILRTSFSLSRKQKKNDID